MKKILFILVMSCLAFGHAQAQTNKSDVQFVKQKRKTAKKALEEMQDSIAYTAAVNALKQGSWVLEANNVVFRNGLMRYVSSNTNFISMNDGEGVVQTAFSNFIYSPNGLGGVTVKGTAKNTKMEQDKDGNLFCSYSIQGASVSAVINVSLSAKTNQASIVIIPNFSGNTMTMNGNLIPYESSDVFQGQSF